MVSKSKVRVVKLPLMPAPPPGFVQRMQALHSEVADRDPEWELKDMQKWVTVGTAIRGLSVQEQAMYADSVVRALCVNREDDLEHINALAQDMIMGLQDGATGLPPRIIGNVALVALTTQSPQLFALLEKQK